MGTVEDYVSRIDGTCGKEQDVIVTFKYGKKDEAIRKILERATTRKSVSPMISELSFRSISFRLYGSGKAIFRDIESREILNSILTDLLS